jgi:hypothetical protein
MAGNGHCAAPCLCQVAAGAAVQHEHPGVRSLVQVPLALQKSPDLPVWTCGRSCKPRDSHDSESSNSLLIIAVWARSMIDRTDSYDDVRFVRL